MLVRLGVPARFLGALLGGIAAVALALGLGSGCGEEKDSPLVSATDFGDLLIVAGNNQTGQPGEPVKQALTVQVVDRRGRPVAGVKVQFRVTAGGGVLFDTTDVPAVSKEKDTGSDGRAQVRLLLGPSPGPNLVTAAVAGMQGLPPTFTAVAEGEVGEGGLPLAEPGGFPDAGHFSLAVEKLNMPGGVHFGLENRITAFVFNASSNPVGAGTVVRFRTNGGGIEESARTDVGGRAVVTLTTAEPVPQDGWVTVVAETAGEGGVLLTAQTRVLFSGPTLIRLIQPASFSVKAGEAQAFRFFVGDTNGNPLVGGTTVQATAEGGRIVGQQAFTLSDTQSPDATQFSVVFQATEGEEASQLIIEVNSPNGDKKVAFVSGSKDSGQDTVVRLPEAISLVAADSLLVADGISSTTIRATVRDSAGNGVPNQTVEFSANAGTVDAFGLTDAAGQAAVIYRSAMRPEGMPEVTVSARTGRLTAETRLRLLGVRLWLAASPEVLAADGIAQTTITAVLETEQGAPTPSVPVDFAATVGTLSAAGGRTDVAGRASVVYRGVASREDLAGVEVRVRAAGLDAAVALRLLGVRLQLVASPDTIAADGNAQAAINVHLQRTDDVAIANASIHLEGSLGELSAAAVETDAEGNAQAILVAGTEEGKATVKATYGDGLTEWVAVAFVKGSPASIVLVAVDPPAIGVRGAGANETALVTFEVRDARGNTVADGETVFFKLLGPSGRERVGPDSTATVDGRVQAAVSSDTLAGTVQLTARARTSLAGGDTVRSEPVPIAIHGGHPDQMHFSLAAKPVNLAGRVILGLESQITAFVFDQYANPVPPNTAVYFTTNGGGVQGSALTDRNGQATVKLFTAAPMPPAADTYLATVTGKTLNKLGIEIEAETKVLFSGPTAPIETDIGSGIFLPEGGQQIVTFKVADIDGNPLMGGSTILVTSDVARISGDKELTLPDVRSGHTDYAIVIADPMPNEDPPLPPQTGSVLIKVQSLNGNQQLVIGVTVD